MTDLEKGIVALKEIDVNVGKEEDVKSEPSENESC